MIILLAFIATSFVLGATFGEDSIKGAIKNVFVTNELLDMFVTNQPIPPEVAVIADYMIIEVHFSEYYEENKEFYEEGTTLEEQESSIREQLQQQKLSVEFQNWLTKVQAEANIRRLISY